MEVILTISGTKDSWNTGALVHEVHIKPISRHIMYLSFSIPCKDTFFPESIGSDPMLIPALDLSTYFDLDLVRIVVESDVQYMVHSALEVELAFDHV